MPPLISCPSKRAPSFISFFYKVSHINVSEMTAKAFFFSLSGPLVDTGNHGVVSLERLEGKLLLGLDALLPELDNLSGEDGLGGGSGIDTVGLDGNDNTTSDLEEQVCVETDNTGLIGLSHIGKDAVDHTDKHAVLERVTGILDDGDDVCAVGGHVDQITTGTVRKLDGVDGTGRTDNIGDVRDGSSRGGTEVENLATGLHVDVLHTTEDTGSQLGTERVPHTVLDLCGCGSVLTSGGITSGRGGSINGDAFLAVDGNTGGDVLCAEHVLLSTGNEDTGMTMGLL